MDTLPGVGRAGLPNAIELGGAVLSVVVCGALLWFGVTVAIPQFGLFGLLWTVFLVAIIAVNLRRIWVRRSNRSYGWRALQDSDRKDGGS